MDNNRDMGNNKGMGNNKDTGNNKHLGSNNNKIMGIRINRKEFKEDIKFLNLLEVNPTLHLDDINLIN